MTNNLVLDVGAMNQNNLAIADNYVPYSLDPGDEQDVSNPSYWAASDGYRGGLHIAGSLKVGVPSRLEDDGISALTSEMCGQVISDHEASKKLKL